MRERIRLAWEVYANVSAVAMTAAILTAGLLGLVTPNSDLPVIEATNPRLLTPTAPVGGSFTFQVDRKSYESCPGWGVVVFTRTDAPNVVISGRFPLATPGCNSPPPLTITRPVLRGVTPGTWNVETGVDSRCPTRQKYDVTGKFTLEVTDAQ